MHWLLPNSFMRPDGSVRQDWRAYIIALVLVDAAAVIGALALSFYVRSDPVRDVVGFADMTLARYALLGAVVLVAWLAATRSLALYDRDLLLGGTDEYARVVQAGTLVLVGIVLVDFVVESSTISGGWLGLFWVSLVGLTGLARFVARRVAYGARRWGLFHSRVIIVGADQRAVELARHLETSAFEVLGFLDDYRSPGSSLGGNGWRVLGSASQLNRLDRLEVDEIVVVPSAISWESRQALMEFPEQRRFDIRVLASREGALTAGVKVSHRAHVPVYVIEAARITGLEAAVKRSFDVAVALALVVIVGPFAALRLAAGAIRRRPLLERHQILGKAATPFTVYSLAGEGSRVVSKLPAVLNVLRGQMSIVGPLPIQGGRKAVAAELRLLRPGLTSVVLAHDEDLDSEAALSIQLDYVRSYSIWRDLQVLWHRVMSARRNDRSGKRDRSALWAPVTPPAEQRLRPLTRLRLVPPAKQPIEREADPAGTPDRFAA